MPPVPRDRVEAVYRQIQRAVPDLGSNAVGDGLTELYAECLLVLGGCTRTELTSRIAGKEYFAFEQGTRISRAINAAFYDPDPIDWASFLAALRARAFEGLDPIEITRTLYSLAISFCSVIDLTRTGDQKTPGTFFEWFIGHIFAKQLETNPTTRLPVLNLDMETTLPTDFTFDLGQGRPKFHLPVKTSTRERVIQVWAHQRVLDGVYGTGRFLGTPVILAETKTDSRRREVVEICLPDQWRIYQMHIAQLRRIYYLDVPAAYERLNDVFPPLHVYPFGQFFFELDELVA